MQVFAQYKVSVAALGTPLFGNPKSQSLGALDNKFKGPGLSELGALGPCARGPDNLTTGGLGPKPWFS